MCVSVLSVCVCMSVCQLCVPGARGGQKKASFPLELKLIIVSSYVSAGNQIWGLWKSSILNL